MQHSSSQRIDVHHHFISKEYVSAWGEDKIGSISAAGRVVPWSVELSLDLMDRNGIATALTSVSSPGWPQGPLQQRLKLCRACNDLAARMVRDHFGRFGMFANLPLPDIDPTL